MSIISDIIKYSRLAYELRDFFQNTISFEQSKQAISERLHNRERNFLSLTQRGIYQNPGSPYLKMLREVGFEFGDIASLVNRDGVEATLLKLLAEGIYLSWEEFKGKKEIVRGSSHFQFQERDFDNPFLSNYYQAQSSGSRSAGTRTTFDLQHTLQKSYYRLPKLAVNNALDVPLGVWKAILPSSAGIGNILTQYKVGKPAAKWFSFVDERQVRVSLHDRLAMRYIIYGSRLWGAKLTKPEYAGLEDAAVVAKWMADTKRQFGGCALICSVSPAVKLCQAAMEKGLDIKDTHLIVSGEPLTEAKREQMELTGATVTCRYNISEIGRIGAGCLNDGADDDVHLFHDATAVIQHSRKVEHADIFVDAFVFTTILPSVPKILINVESDDYGIMETRSCDCLFGQLGFDRHMYNIRSFAKLTGSGMTIIGTDIVHILEEVLPRTYGGAATDYQILEEEDNTGETHLSLIISPKVEAVDESDVIATVLNELHNGVYGGKLAAGLWSQARTIQVKRMHPISTWGKVAPLHLIKRE
ncbi:hypothetical protein ACFLTP_02500 [Chloroflexota bacterium]